MSRDWNKITSGLLLLPERKACHAISRFFRVMISWHRRSNFFIILPYIICHFPPPAAPSVLQKAKASYSFWYKILVDSPKPFRLNLGGKIDGYFLELLEYVFISLYLPPEQKISRLTTAI